MARVAEFDKSVVDRAQNIVACTRDAKELREALSVVLVAVGGLSSETAAKVLGMGIATVGRHQRAMRRGQGEPPEVRLRWGGRRRQLLTITDEQNFLLPWIAQAEKGGVLIVPPIHRALEKRIGHKVAAPTVYRLLARHGWRKVAPEPHHPKRNVESQEAFKKNGRRFWRKVVR